MPPKGFQTLCASESLWALGKNTGDSVKTVKGDAVILGASRPWIDF